MKTREPVSAVELPGRADAADGLQRRALLLASLAGALGGGLPLAARAAAPSARTAPGTGSAGDLLGSLAELQAYRDGRPAFWFSHGVEYALLDGEYHEVYRRVVVTTTRVDRPADGGAKLLYAEFAYSTAPGSLEYTPELTSPVTGKPFRNPTLGPFRAVQSIDANGKVAYEVKTSTGVGRYHGEISLRTGSTGDTWVDSVIAIDIERPTGKASMMEFGPLKPDHSQPRGKDYTPATRDVIVHRALPEDVSGGRAGTMLGFHYGRKFPDARSLVAAMDEVEKRMFAKPLEQIPGLLAQPY